MMAVQKVDFPAPAGPWGGVSQGVFDGGEFLLP
jgi:hypothetical protein